MSGLSPASTRFLRHAKRHPELSSSDESYGQAYTQLFCELYDIMREVKTSLEMKNLGKWVLTYTGSEMNRTLSFSFNLHQGAEGQRINLDMVIDPFDTSHLTISYDGCCGYAERQLEDFMSTPAFKRYFGPYGSDTKQLKTEISPRQIGSRHFGDYLVFLCEMSIPYIECLKTGMAQAVAVAA